MQLISVFLLLFSLLALVGAMLFVAMWQRARRKINLVQILHDGIGHVGVSAVVEYPETSAPLIALLEEEYPRSEAIIVTDMQERLSTFEELLSRYHLIKVNHDYLDGVRALYRSRSRTFRRVVMVDLPMEYRAQAASVGRAVASYDHILYLKGESIVEPNALAYCANVIAMQRPTNIISMQSIAGCGARLERGVAGSSGKRVRLRTNYALAWRRNGVFFALSATILPAAMLFLAFLSGSRMIFASAVITALAVVSFLYLSCRVVTEKGLFRRLDTILRNFCRFLVEKARNFHYLYGKRVQEDDPILERAPVLEQRRNNRRRV